MSNHIHLSKMDECLVSVSGSWNARTPRVRKSPFSRASIVFLSHNQCLIVRLLGKHPSPASRVLRNDLPMDTWIRPTRPYVHDFSEYVPEAIRRDYEEACLIRILSPKASATLSRRCLQGMIRDFHGVKRKRNLKQEIEAIKNKIDPQIWNAIDGLRKIGNIGAHMEKDVNLIVDVDPEEAQKLIKLNELLFREWYINREERRKLVQEVADIGKQKQAEKKAGNKPAADA